jgi:aminoglycoside 6'-N-acetyltransferase
MTALRSLSPGQQVTYQFRPLSSAHLPRLRAWLAEPHVREWWGNPVEQFALLEGDLADPAMDQFMVAHAGRPFAYLQSYDLAAWPDAAFRDQPKGTRAIDQFIGEADMLDRGHGSAFVRAFVEIQLAAGAPRVITDPDPLNARAIRAYEKAGFRKVRLVDTQDGRALLMVRDAADPAVAL